MAFTRTGVAAVLLLVGVRGGERAQAQDAPLRGPDVREREVPGVQAQYVPGDVGGLGMMERPVPVRVYFDAIRSLGDEDAPEDVRLTDAQRDSLRQEVQRFSADLRGYLDAVRPEVDELLDSLPRAERQRLKRQMEEFERLGRGVQAALDPGTDRRGRGGAMGTPGGGNQRTPRETAEVFRLRLRDQSPPPQESDAPEVTMGDDSPGSADAEALARLREIRDAAPSQAALQTRVWTLLSEAQRERVGQDIRDFQAGEQRRVQEQRLERQLAQRRQVQPAPATDAARPNDLGEEAIERIVRAVRAGERPEPLWSRLPERARARLDSLAPEERAQAIERLLRRRAPDSSMPAAEQPG